MFLTTRWGGVGSAKAALGSAWWSLACRGRRAVAENDFYIEDF